MSQNWPAMRFGARGLRHGLSLVVLSAGLVMKPGPVAARYQTSTGNGKWVLAVDLGKCTLTRRTPGPNPSVLQIETQPGTDRFVLTLGDDAMRSSDPGVPGEGVLRVDGRRVSRNFGGFWPDRNGFKIVYVMGGLTWAEIQPLGSGTELAIDTYGGSIPAVALAGAGKALAALNKCVEEQLIDWGADPAQFAQGGAQPKVGDRFKIVPQDIVRKITYPKGAIEPLHYAVLSETGVVERCASVYGVRDSDMESVVCTYLNGRKIGEPARDASGKAVRGVVAFTPALRRTVVRATRN